MTQNILGKKKYRIDINNENISNNESIIKENDYYIIKEESPDKITNKISLKESQETFKDNQIKNDINDYKTYENKIKVKHNNKKNIIKIEEFKNINQEAEDEIKNNKIDYSELDEKENDNEIIYDSLSLKYNSINNSFKNSRIFNDNLSLNNNDSFSYIINELKKINTKTNLGLNLAVLFL